MSSDTDQGEQTVDGTNPSEGTADAPLAPYPPNLDPPWLHFRGLMTDLIGFGERALATRDVCRMRILGRGDQFVVGHPDHLKRALVTEREKFRKSQDFRIAFGEGLLTVEGAEWQRQREAMQPLFTRDSVLGYADGIVEQVRRRVDRWTDGQRLDLQREFTDLALDVLFATVLGRELDLDGDRRLRESAEHLHDWFQPTSYLLPEWMPTPARRRFKSAKRTVEAEAERLLDERAGDAPADPTDAEDLLSLLVGLREAGAVDSGMLTDERLRDQMVTIVFAGHDTTTTTLTFSCWALANHPEVRERFHAEIDALDGPPTVDDLDTLPVTERIVTETLRLYPPVYTLPRLTTESVVFDGYRVPEDELLGLAIRHVHRDPRFYDDPEQFRPSRWDGDLRSDLHDFAYAPFGGGPRICIGRQFALLEAKLTLATLGRQYELGWLGENDANGEPPVSPEMTLRMEPGQEFLVTER
jgi:cytochrome P450